MEGRYLPIFIIVAPYAVNLQVKQRAFGAESDVPLDLQRFIHIVRSSGYRGYLLIETLSVKGKDYDPFTVVPKFLEELRQAISRKARYACSRNAQVSFKIKREGLN